MTVEPTRASEAQRRRLTFGVILTIIGIVASIVSFNTTLHMEGQAIAPVAISVIVLLGGLGLLARYIIVRRRA